MKLIILAFSLFYCSLTQLVSQSDLLSNTALSQKFQYICGSDPYRFYSEFPCNMYPMCINGGFKINVGCIADYQCTPYSQNAVCVNSCCCTVPRIIDSGVTTTRRFFDDNSVQPTSSIFFATVFVLFVGLF